MRLKKITQKIGIASLCSMMALSAVSANITAAHAEEASTKSTEGAMGSVTSSAQKSANSKNDAVQNQVDLEMSNGKLRVTFIKDNAFRLNFESTGNDFVVNAKPFVNPKYNKVFILDKHESDYTGVEPTVNETANEITLSTNTLTLTINKDTSLMKLTKKTGEILWEEAEPIKTVEGKTTQTLKTTADEYFYGGGTQNGYFSHKNTKLLIQIGGGWEDGGRSNPVPFYMSTKGYAVMRHTFTPGEYDFSETATFTHKEERFDAFYFVNDSLKGEINDFTELTGRPVFWPRWAQYIGHADCYNYNANTGERDLNVHGKAVLENYVVNKDVPLGWLLPQDGYGCHYGKTGTVDGNIQNLKQLVDRANELGVQVGMWTQSDLYNESPDVLRNVDKEVLTAGTRGIKTDVAWVGQGYDMQMNSVSTGYDAIAKSGDRPYIFSLYGWAGSQRYAGMWSGDQTGGRWEYIRFQIPTYIGSGLSGQPNIGSDIDSIYKGTATIATRDVQWKVFTPMLYNMGGWDGSKADELDGKTPWEFGGQYEAIQRFYLKLRAEMTPYNYTIAHDASLTGTPMLRAMVLEYPNDPYTYGKETQYQYMWGENFLVAPVYEGEGKDTDIGKRNNIYLPDTDQTWIDYFSGAQYQGGVSLYNYDAPLWKLPLFVKSGAIIPMTEENNASGEITDDKDRIFQFYPDGATDFELFEDDGKSINSGSATTLVKSTAPEIDATGNAADGTAVLEIAKRQETGGYAASDKATEFIVNTHKKPTKVTLEFNGTEQTLTEVTKDEYIQAVNDGDDTRNIYYYDTAYNMNKYTGKELVNGGEIIAAPRLIVRTVKTDVSETAMKLTVEGFNNSNKATASGTIAAVPTFDAVNQDTLTPRSITLTWADVADATSYDIEANGHILTNVTSPFLHKDLPNLTEYTYKIRSVNAAGHSAWSAPITASTKDDPFRRVPETITVSWNGPNNGSWGGNLPDIVDKNFGTQYHSLAGATGKQVVFDMQYAYPIESFLYVPRQDYPDGMNGNGTVKDLDLEVSIDGVTWKTVAKNYTTSVPGVQQLQFDNVYGDLITFDSTYARYIRLTVNSTIGDFFTAQECVPIISEGGKPRTAGSALEHTNALSDTDLVPMKMYSGSIPGDTTWGQVESADVNYNNISDAYDLVNITSKMGGGIKPSAENKVSGMINAKATVNGAINTGDELTVTVLGNNLTDINALSAEFVVNKEDFEIVDSKEKTLVPSVNTLGMLNYSRYNPHGQNSDNPTLFMDFANLGNKERLNGDVVLGTFKIRAKKAGVTPDITVQNALVVNSHMAQKEANPATPEVEVPEVKEGKVAREDFTLTFSTPGITDDNGANLFQFGLSGVAALFDGDLNTTGELLWSRDEATEEVVRLPLTMNFQFDAPKNLKEIKVYNRVNGTNGIVREMQAIGYRGDTAIDLGSKTDSDADYSDSTYKFEVPAGSGVFDRVEIIAKRADNMTMTTLREIELFETNDIAVESIEVGEAEVDLHVGEVISIPVTVNPTSARDRNVTLSNDADTISEASLVKGDDGKRMVLLSGLAKGTSTITITSTSNTSVTATIKVNVTDELNLTDFNKFKAQAEAKIEDGDLWQKEGRDALNAAYEKATGLDLSAVDQAKVDEVTLELATAIANLVMRESNPDELIPETELKATASHTSGEDVPERVLDNEKSTYWESPWGGEFARLPQSVTIELPVVSKVNQIDYVPFTARNGLIREYNVYVSKDGKTFTKVSSGSTQRASDADYSTYSVLFKTVEAKYVKFEATSTYGRIADEDDMYARIAELDVYGTCNATGIEINNEATTLKLNETLTLDTVLKPSYANNEITYTSSDANVVSVDANGVVTGLKKGTATITATANGKTATIEITVDPFKDLTPLIEEIEEFVGNDDNKVLYTTTSWNDLVSALDAAKAMNDTNTQDEIDAAQEALEAAKENLVELTTKDKLEAKINQLKEIKNDDATYTAGSYQALQDEIAKAEAVLADPDADEEAWSVALKGLLDAEKGLVDLTELRDAVNAVVKPEGDYSAASSAKFDEIVANATALLTKADASAEEVAEALEAVTNINDVLVDVKDLRALIADAKANAEAGKDTFLPSYLEKLQTLITNAEKALENALTDQEVADVTKALKQCNSAPKYKGDKSELTKAVKDAEKYVSKKDDYTASSYVMFEKALEKAKATLEDENADQTAINNALNALNKAIEGLKVKPSDPSNPDTPDTPDTPDNPDQPNKPGTPDYPDQPNKPGTPDNPGKPDQPNKPGKPVIPNPVEPNKPIKPGYVTQIDNNKNNVSVIGKFPSDVVLIVDDLAADVKANIIAKITNKDAVAKYKFERIFDIYMLRNGVTYTPEGSFTVKIKLDDELKAKRYLGIVYISDDGKATTIPSKVADGYITFTTNHNSYYAIVSSDSPIVDTATQPVTASSIPAFILLGAVLIFVTKKMEKVLED